MYLRPIHAEHDIPTLRSLIHETQLGILITAFDPTGTSSDRQLHSTHVPWVLHVDDPKSETELGVLQGHMARQNPQAKLLVELANSKANKNDNNDGVIEEQDVMVLFTAPQNAYISPSFYTSTKPATGKVVPTWDYASVAAYGKIRVYAQGGEGTGEFLDEQVDKLTRESEAKHLQSRSQPRSQDGDKDDEHQEGWKVSDAPTPYINVLKRAIIGIEIKITRLEGKWKMSQEISEGDRRGVVEGLERRDMELGMEMGGRGVGKIVEERGEVEVKKKEAAGKV
jgi:transcriptional regulator